MKDTPRKNVLKNEKDVISVQEFVIIDLEDLESLTPPKTRASNIGSVTYSQEKRGNTISALNGSPSQQRRRKALQSLP